MGRNPKPTALKILQGNPGKRPLPDNEPQPTGKAVMPGWLLVGAREVWAEFAPIVGGMGLLTDADAETFGRWCSLAAEFRLCPTSMPANRIARMDALESRFGLDPSSRAKLGMASQKKKKENPFKALAG